MSFQNKKRPHEKRVYWYQNGGVSVRKCYCQKCMQWDYVELQVVKAILTQFGRKKA